MARYSRKSRHNGKIRRELCMKAGKSYRAKPTGRCGRTGKMGYADRLAAMIALSRCASPMNRKSKREEKRVYRCPFCSMWHLTPRDLFPPKNQSGKKSKKSGVRQKVHPQPIKLSSSGSNPRFSVNTAIKPDVGQELVLW